ncbi:MAG: acyltransferase family protein [Candidatus Acidiferrum sp.]
MIHSLASKPSIKYRPDIDGLRAVAVLLVIAYHLGIHRFLGGFVGVDVFFVISGFLISSVILSELDESRFSLLSFYERRIRRIFPALAVLLLVTTVFAYKFLLPLELLDYSKSLLAATFSSSNFYFLSQAGYFDAPATMKPLLHTWSLAVEEQFYIFFPLFLMVSRKFFSNKLRTFVVVAAALSFAVSAIGVFLNRAATFYLAPARAWELLLGTMLALDLFPAALGAVWRNIASMTGVVLIFMAGVLFTPATPFPGAAALLPSVGAALIISAGKSGCSIVGRILSLRPIVFIGLISYSLYLWHWPLIVFQNADGFFIRGLSPKLTKLALILASFVLATLSWKFIEQPFRNRRKVSRPAIFRSASLAAVALVVVGAITLSAHGFPSRYPAAAVKVASFLNNTDTKTDAQFRVGTCFLTSKNSYDDFNPSICLRRDPRRPNDLILGDSHAAQLWYGLSATFEDISFMQATASGCKPTLDQSHSVEPKCSRLMEYILNDYLTHHSVNALIIAARWDGNDVEPLRETLEWAQKRGIHVVLFGPIIQYDSALPRLLALSIKSNDPAIPTLHRVEYYKSLDLEMSQLANSIPGVRYVSYFRMLCRQNSCLEYADAGVPLQSDYGHLTGSGSLLVATRLRDARVLN